jgi:hypothetical protein
MQVDIGINFHTDKLFFPFAMEMVEQRFNKVTQSTPGSAKVHQDWLWALKNEVIKIVFVNG